MNIQKESLLAISMTALSVGVTQIAADKLSSGIALVLTGLALVMLRGYFKIKK